ncbi:redoxin domain-containing protein [Streptomyces sp. ISL-96]|uniref:redoxin domain-containing protein n=1 Tax=Streptomyces sp. ISL-96 TaxID=2819191 RepID=UPI0027E345B4|nr:redoxin domain-containing protein [Streptomyces sp. ISL-96]
MPETGDHMGDFALPGGVLEGTFFARRDFLLCRQRGAPLVLVFPHGDEATGYGEQLRSYSDGLETVPLHGAQVWGISSQCVKSNELLARKYNLRIPLLSDTSRSVARAFGITASGTELRQAVFLIAPDGTLHWKHVAPLGAALPSLTTLCGHVADTRGR